MTTVSFRIGKDVVTNTYDTVDRYLVMLKDIQAYMVRYTEFHSVPTGDKTRVKLFWKDRNREYILPYEAANLVADTYKDREFRIKVIHEEKE